MARTGCDELFFARIFVNNWSASRNRQVRGYVFHQHFLLAAEPASDTWFDDADTLDRQVQNRCQDATCMERHLCRGPNYQPVVLVPIRHADMRFDVRLLHLGDSVLSLEDAVSLGEAFIDVADVDSNFSSQVASRV